MSERFATVLRRLREGAGLSQSGLAASAGIEHSYVSRLEAGKRVPSHALLLRLSEALTLRNHERDALLLSAGYAPLILYEMPELGDGLIALARIRDAQRGERRA